MLRPPEFAQELDPAAPTVWVRFDLQRAIDHYRRGYYYHRDNLWRSVVATDPQHDWRCLEGRIVILDNRERDTDPELIRQILHDGAAEVYFVYNNTECCARIEE